jgi:hypothetical protein
MKTELERLRMYQEVKRKIFREVEDWGREGEYNHYLGNCASLIGLNGSLLIPENNEDSGVQSYISNFQNKRAQTLWAYAQMRVFLNWLNQDPEARERFTSAHKEGQRAPNKLYQMTSSAP